MRFSGIREVVPFALEGNFHRDIRGCIIRFKGDADPTEKGAQKYMKGFCKNQTGEAGDMTAGLPPADYVNYPYIEWYGDDNGRGRRSQLRASLIFGTRYPN